MKTERKEMLSEILQDLILMRRKIKFHAGLAKKGNASIIYPAQREFLSLLAQGGEKSVSELAKALDVSAGAITQLSEPLKVSGLIKREIDREDRRKINIKLTAKGEVRLKAFTKEALEKLSKLLEPLTREELEAFKNINRKIVSNVVKKKENIL